MIRITYEVTYTVMHEPPPRQQHAIEFDEHYEAIKFIRDHCRWFAYTELRRVQTGAIELAELLA